LNQPLRTANKTLDARAQAEELARERHHGPSPHLKGPNLKGTVRPVVKGYQGKLRPMFRKLGDKAHRVLAAHEKIQQDNVDGFG
jgi:hypothetical protein